MTNGGGKSDSAIVAVKPTNKAERSATESVEPRAEAKGNAGQQSTLRTQSRDSVSQALERIRQVVKQGKKAEKLTTLLHHVSSDLLRTAFYELKAGAAPGVDGVTWKDYEADLNDNIWVNRRPSNSWASLLSAASLVGASSSYGVKPGRTVCERS